MPGTLSRRSSASSGHSSMTIATEPSRERNGSGSPSIASKTQSSNVSSSIASSIGGSVARSAPMRSVTRVDALRGPPGTATATP